MDSKPVGQQNDSELDGFAEVTSVMVHSSTRWIRNLFPNLRDAAIRWSEDDASSLAASVAYYLALSLFPMMLLLTSGIGLFLEFSNGGRGAEAKILSTVEQVASPVVKQQIEQVLKQLRNQSIVSGPFGVAAAILAAIGVFAQIDRGFDRIFRIPVQKDTSVRRTVYRIIRHRCLAFLMLVCLGGTILILFATSMIVSQLRSVTGSSLPSLRHAFGLFDFLFAVLTNALLFSLVYRWLPKKRVELIDAVRGGLLAACIWELGRTVLGMFLIGMRYTSAYGAIGSFIAILLWCYYGISILFFGAEYVQVLEFKRRARSSESTADLGVQVFEGPLPDDRDFALAQDSTIPDESNQARRSLLTPEPRLDRQQPRRSTSIR
jgi:membrane protein